MRDHSNNAKPASYSTKGPKILIASGEKSAKASNGNAYTYVGVGQENQKKLVYSKQ